MRALSEDEKAFLASWQIEPFPSFATAMRAIMFIRHGNGTYGDDVPTRAGIVRKAQKEWTNVRIRYAGRDRVGIVVCPFFVYHSEVAGKRMDWAHRVANQQGTRVQDEFVRATELPEYAYRLLVHWDTPKLTTDISLSCADRIPDPPSPA